MAVLSREPNIERLRKRGDLAGLCRAAAWHDWVRGSDGRAVDLGVNVRRRAVAALVRFDRPEARRAIRDALLDEAESVRIAATESVRTARDRDSVRVLVYAALDGGSARVRSTALEALAQIDPAESALELAAAVTVRHGDGVNPDFGEEIRELLVAAGDDGRWVAGLLATALVRCDEHVARRAEELLRSLPGLPIDPFVEALEAGPRRALVARALGHLHDARALQPLVELIDDPDEAIRRDAVAALGELKHPDAVDPLLQATSDPEYAVREAAIAALDGLGNVGVVLGVRSIVDPTSNAARSGGLPQGPGSRIAGLADELVRRVRTGRLEPLEPGTPPDRPTDEDKPPA
jgi:HEAT repeat protein